jgi:hypothetical protein
VTVPSNDPAINRRREMLIGSSKSPCSWNPAMSRVGLALRT